MENGDSYFFSLLAIVGISTLITVRIFYVVYRSSKQLYDTPPGPLSTMIVLGGHTAEMLNLLAVMKMYRFKLRYNIAAATDNMSLQKARLLEDSLLVKVLGIRRSSIFYVESIARVGRLSLSGLLLYKIRIADQLFVQWPQLKSKQVSSSKLCWSSDVILHYFPLDEVHKDSS